MLKKNSYQSVDSLIQGIKTVLSENRCSFSDEEKVLLNDCLITLQQSKKVNDGKLIPNLELIVKVVEIIVKLFVVSDNFKDGF